jgi:hypothetical protein
MTYSADAFYIAQGETIALATSPDLIHWTRYGTSPIIGEGYGGVAHPAGQSFQLHIGKEWRIYFSDETNKNVYYCTSSDGYHYKFIATPVLTINQFDPPCTNDQIDGMGIVSDGKAYWGLAELEAGNCPDISAYELWLAKDTGSNAVSFTSASGSALDSLIPAGFGIGTIFAGGRSTVKIGNHYHTWEHVRVPSNIWHGESNDLFNWKCDPTPVVVYSQYMWGLKNCNQVADTSIIEYKGNTYLFYDGTDNADKTGAIGYSRYNGTLVQYDACYLPWVPVSVLAVGGGGGGGGNIGGGGGAGGYIYNPNVYLNLDSYSVSVGNGGIGGTAGNSGSKGSDSIFSTIDAAGGGGGAGTNGQGVTSGGCGGGGSAIQTNGAPVNGSQGYRGGNGYNVSPCFGGGGGGGTASAGGIEDRVNCIAGNGGKGTACDITGTKIYYGGGGGGGGYHTGNCKNGSGGQGGGGNGGYSANANGNDGAANTGGGGGGAAAGNGKGGNGGSGIVVISYLTSLGKGTGGTITYNGPYTVHTFTSSGTFVPPAINTPTPVLPPQSHHKSNVVQ